MHRSRPSRYFRRDANDGDRCRAPWTSSDPNVLYGRWPIPAALASPYPARRISRHSFWSGYSSYVVAQIEAAAKATQIVPMDATAPQIGVNLSRVPRQCDAIAEHPCIQWRRFGGFASACSSNWRIASERFRACPIDVKLSRVTPVSSHRHTKGPMRLRTPTRTATKTRAPRSDNGSQRDRAFLGENLLKRHASPV